MFIWLLGYRVEGTSLKAFISLCHRRVFLSFFAVHNIFLLLYMNFQLCACVCVEGLTTMSMYINIYNAYIYIYIYIYIQYNNLKHFVMQIIITVYLITLRVLYILK